MQSQRYNNCISIPVGEFMNPVTEDNCTDGALNISTGNLCEGTTPRQTGDNEADGALNITTENTEEICEGTTPKQTVDNEADGDLNISTENTEEIIEGTTPKQTGDFSDDGAQNVTTDADVSQRSEEPVADNGQQSQHEAVGSYLMPLRKSELVDFSDFITYDTQERISIMLGFDLNKVETLRCKHRENVTGVNLDLLIDWTIRNPQPTNRLVSNNR